MFLRNINGIFMVEALVAMAICAVVLVAISSAEYTTLKAVALSLSSFEQRSALISPLDDACCTSGASESGEPLMRCKHGLSEATFLLLGGQVE